MNYTKGEWKETEFTQSEGYAGTIRHIYISPVGGKFKDRTVADIGFWRDFPEEEVHANAHLIAAAPEMYEALKAASNLLNGYTSANDNESLKTAIKQAIAKAEGK